MQKTLRMNEIEHRVFVGDGAPKPGTARMLALTARMTLACQR
jgi:hypothetical protein